VGLVLLEIKQNISLCTISQIFSGFTTARAVDPIPLCRDFPVPSNVPMGLIFGVFFKQLKVECFYANSSFLAIIILNMSNS
jgi:hypothetical protein